jgi:hypothetical protein
MRQFSNGRRKKDTHKNPEGWQGQKRRRTLDRIGEAESVGGSVFVPDRTPDKFSRCLFSFRGRLKLRIAAVALDNFRTFPYSID